MTALIVVIAIAAIASAIYAFLRRPRGDVGVASPAGDFTDLNEAERCDYVFALSALDDPASIELIRRAMDDPSDVVATAAARSLVLTGRRDEVDALLARRDDARSQRIAAALELMA
jgi:hypothetical protein